MNITVDFITVILGVLLAATVAASLRILSDKYAGHKKSMRKLKVLSKILF